MTSSTSSRRTLAGHCRGVAALVAEVAQSAGIPEAGRVMLRRAGLLHDLGRLGVSNAIWDKPVLLSDVEPRAGASAPVPHRQDAGQDPRARSQP